jgi:hypothetical protein
VKQQGNKKTDIRIEKVYLHFLRSNKNVFYFFLIVYLNWYLTPENAGPGSGITGDTS